MEFGRTGFSLSGLNLSPAQNLKRDRLKPVLLKSYACADGAHARDSDRREIDANRFGRAIGLLHAGPDRRAGQIISGEKQSRDCSASASSDFTVWVWPRLYCGKARA